jgi:hypothetical protein
MAVLFGGGRVNDNSTPATSLRIQTSLNGQPVAIVHGQARLAGNLIWYGNFRHAGSGKSSGGKGGVFSGGKGQQETTYSADLLIGLCEGPIVNINTIWSGQTVETGAKINVGTASGTPGQAPLSVMSTTFPAYALGYSDLAYAYAFPLQLGASPALPGLNFELAGPISAAVQEIYPIASGSGYVFTPHYFNLSACVTEQVTIPATSPYQVQAQNPIAATLPQLLLAGGKILGSAIPGSASQGVVDINGRAFTRIDSGTPATGQYLMTMNASGWLYTFAAADAGLQVTIVDFAAAPGVFMGGTAMTQVLGTPDSGEFSVSVQPGSFGQYRFAATDAGTTVTIVDVFDADPSASLADYLANARYGCGFPTANIGDLSALQNYAYATGLFISPAWVASQAANDYLRDFATGLNGEFVWSSGSLTFVPYGDTAISGFGKTYTPPSAPIYTLDDDDFMKNEGTAGVGVSAFTSDDPVVCVRTRPSDAYNDVKVEYLDRGNSYNPAVAEAQDNAGIDAYGLRPADTKQLHFFCSVAPAMMSAQLQLGRQQVRNLYSFTVPWYFILLDPMDIVAINDSRLGLVNQWVRIREITENQQDGTLTFTAEEYLQGTGSAPVYGSQPLLGYVPNIDAIPSSVN